jgi:hypothetical protein
VLAARRFVFFDFNLKTEALPFDFAAVGDAVRRAANAPNK